VRRVVGVVIDWTIRKVVVSECWINASLAGGVYGDDDWEWMNWKGIPKIPVLLQRFERLGQDGRPMKVSRIFVQFGRNSLKRKGVITVWLAS
jgi:hypothetical protein